MKGKLIVIEGTDCSGKETQTRILEERLKKLEKNVKRYSFPMYETPTGKIIGGPYLGKNYICDGWFPEGAPNVDYKVASLLYAADRAYNIDKINNDLKNGINVILDRYVYSNMAHQGGKIHNKEERLKIYKWLEELEFNLLQFPKPDIKIFLHMPTEYSKELKSNRSKTEILDQHESSDKHLKDAENSYLEISEIYEFKKIECIKNQKVRTIEDISQEIFSILKYN